MGTWLKAGSRRKDRLEHWDIGCYGETSREDRLGKYIDGGKKVHCDCGRCKRPHMLDEGGKQVHLWKILATGGKSPHMLDEGDKQDI